MKTIIYASNNFQNLLCLEAVSEYLKQDDPLPHSTAFNGLVKLKVNDKSITATYLHGADTIMSFTKPVKEEDKSQLKIKYK